MWVGIQVEGVAQNLKNVLSKIKIYLKAIEDGFCTSHSTSTIRFLRQNCDKCCEAAVAEQDTYSEMTSSVNEQGNNIPVCDDSGCNIAIDFEVDDNENQVSDSAQEKKLRISDE